MMIRRWIVALPLALATAAAGLLLAAPVYTGSDGSGVTHKTIYQVNGMRGVAMLFVPVLLTALRVIVPTRGVRIATAVLLAVFVFLSGFSVGLFYIPAALAMLVTIDIES